MDNLNWASGELGCRVIDPEGRDLPEMEWLVSGRGGAGSVGTHVTLRLPSRGNEVTVRYVGWTSGRNLGSNPAVVVVASGESLADMPRLIKAQAKRGAGMQIWFIPGGIPASHCYLRFAVEATFDQPSSPAFATISELFALENAPVVSAARVSTSAEMPSQSSVALQQTLPTTPRRPITPQHRGHLRADVRSESGGRPFAAVLDGLADDIHKLKGLRSPQALRPLPHASNAPKDDWKSEAVPSEIHLPRERGAVADDVVMARLEALERAVEDLDRKVTAQHREQQQQQQPVDIASLLDSHIDQLAARLEGRILQALNERVDASISVLASELAQKGVPRASPGNASSRSGRGHSARPKQVNTTTTTTTTLAGYPGEEVSGGAVSALHPQRVSYAGADTTVNTTPAPEVREVVYDHHQKEHLRHVSEHVAIALRQQQRGSLTPHSAHLVNTPLFQSPDCRS